MNIRTKKRHPVFTKDEDGFMSWTASDGTEITQWTNEEGIISYWKKIDPARHNDRKMLSFEDIKKYDLPTKNIMCKGENGNIIYGDRILQKMNTFKDGSVEYKIWEAKK